MLTKSDERIHKVISKHSHRILQKQNVHGIAKGVKIRKGRKTGKKGVTVFVEAKTDFVSERDRIPKAIDGVQTDVVERPRAEAMPLFGGGYEDHTYGWRCPFMMGDEIGPYRQSQAGTLGFILRSFSAMDGDSPSLCDMGITNFHVIYPPYNSNTNITGHEVSQPAYGWEGQPPKRPIGVVESYMAPDPTRKDNNVDAALIRLYPSTDPRRPNYGYRWPAGLTERYFDRNVLGQAWGPGMASMFPSPHFHKDYVGLVRDMREEDGATRSPYHFGLVEIGDRVWKSGRTTGGTSGSVIATNATMKVAYSGKLGTVTFADQIVVVQDSEMDDAKTNNGRIVGPGDSGSMVVDNQNFAVGLLFAGRESFFIANPIQTVLLSLFHQSVFEYFSPSIESI